MKLDIRFNLFSAIWISVVCITLLLIVILLAAHADNYYEYNKYISNNMKKNIEFYYNCDSGFYSTMYNCPTSLKYKNLTGYYCNQTKICENSYKIK